MGDGPGASSHDVGSQPMSATPVQDDPTLAMVIDKLASLQPDQLSPKQALDALYELNHPLHPDPAAPDANEHDATP